MNNMGRFHLKNEVVMGPHTGLMRPVRGPDNGMGAGNETDR